ncbi:acyl-CoA thioesterase [Herbidospora sp. NBRC 101105]|uniref:acyl-CoA thioesterase n=1 Tax=Herbidospora sp. NBRC 101105 TaxID=3032195 RepID=UPI0024A4F1B1|nr:acyl-CoA thioesterase [Herbidospora sp. NBRC 101105]GLX99557.1 4-hydroxybenzoyl-CoA thioesterase [Herbidospora sp. NBRC 101105]
MNPHFAYEHLVTFADTNLVGNVYFANYVAWQGACRERFLADHAPGVLRGLYADLALVTVSCSCEYFAELQAFDQVSIRMTLRSIDLNRIVMGFDYFRIGNGPGQLVARGAQTVACMQRVEGDLIAIDVPQELYQALDAFAVPGSRR